MTSPVRGVLLSGCAALALSCITPDASAALITSAKSDDLNHSQTNSAFFTSGSAGAALLPDNGWSPLVATQAGAATSLSTTPRKSYNIAGNSTAAGNWTDGNGVPAGITLTFDAQFTITALPAGSLLTNPGATGGTLGGGIGVTQTIGGNDDIDAPDGISVSPVVVSNVVFSGTLADTNFVFTPGGVSGFGTRVFRSNNFNEATAAMVLTQGTDTLGFGTATGNVASNLLLENNFGTAMSGGTPSSIFPRQAGPYTLQVTQGTSVIKGIGLGYDVTYDITVPEPSAAMLAGVGVLTGALARRRRFGRAG